MYQKRGQLLTLILVLAGAVIYLNALHNPFVLDDGGNIEENQQIRSLSSWSVLFAEREMSTAGRPLANLSLAINYAIGGVDPFGYHVFNLAIHLVCGVLLFALLRLLLTRAQELAASPIPPIPGAFAIALLWIVHPLNSELINYVTQRTESLMAVWYLLTVYTSARSVNGGPRWWVVAILCCFLGMATKESMVTAPLMVALVDRIFYFPSVVAAARKRWPLYAGLAASWLLLAALLSTSPRGESAGFTSGVPPWTYLLNQAPLIVRYLRLSVWPSSLVAIYGWPVERSLSDVLVPALTVVALLVATIVALRKQPLLGFIGAWFFVTLAPTSSVIPIATEVGAERRMYLALPAVLTLVVLAAVMLWRRITPVVPAIERAESPALTVSVATLVLASAMFGATTLARNEDYRSEISIAQTSIDRRPTASGHHVLGEALLDAGDRARAIEQLRMALPDAPRAHYTLGIELFKDGNYAEAAEHLRLFLDKQPRLVWVIDAHGYLGQALYELKRWPEAITEFQAVLQMNQDQPTALRLLGDALSEVQRYETAIPYYQRYIAHMPNDADALNALGLALASTNRPSEAAVAFRQATMADPRNGPAHHNLAMVLYQLGEIDQAVEAARVDVALQPDNADSRELLTGLVALQRKTR